MREQALGANLLHESVSRASSLVCTEICLSWHDVSSVGQSNWFNWIQSDCFIIQLPRRVLRVYWLGYLSQERASGACFRSKLPRVYRPQKPRVVSICNPKHVYFSSVFSLGMKTHTRDEFTHLLWTIELMKYLWVLELHINAYSLHHEKRIRRSLTNSIDLTNWII